MANPFEKVLGTGPDLDEVQDKVGQAFDSSFSSFTSFGNLAAGVLLQDIELTKDVPTPVPHNLGRPWSGVILCACNGFGFLATNDLGDTSAIINITIGSPTSQTTFRVSLWVF